MYIIFIIPYDTSMVCTCNTQSRDIFFHVWRLIDWRDDDKIPWRRFPMRVPVCYVYNAYDTCMTYVYYKFMIIDVRTIDIYICVSVCSSFTCVCVYTYTHTHIYILFFIFPFDFILFWRTASRWISSPLSFLALSLVLFPGVRRRTDPLRMSHDNLGFTSSTVSDTLLLIFTSLSLLPLTFRLLVECFNNNNVLQRCPWYVDHFFLFFFSFLLGRELAII